MVQKERARTTPAFVETIPEAAPAPPRSTPWLIGALVAVTAALLALSGWTAYQRYTTSASERPDCGRT